MNVNKRIYDYQSKLAEIRSSLDLIRNDIFNEIRQVAKQQPIKRESKHIFTVRFSELVGNPWNPEFYNWDSSADKLIKLLENIKTEDIPEKILTIYRTKNNNRVDIVHKVSSFGVSVTTKIPIPADFLEKVMENLGIPVLG